LAIFITAMKKIGLVVAIAMVWIGLWYLTMPIYPRFWQFKTLSVYGFILFLCLWFVSLVPYVLAGRSARGVYDALYWLPFGVGIVVSMVWGLAGMPD
jgi:hypothetical protein